MSGEVEGVVEGAEEVVSQEAVSTETESTTLDESPTSEANAEAQVSTDSPTDEQLSVKKKSAQKRIKKLTAEKHHEREAKEAALKKAEELQSKIDELTANKPTLASVDHDETAYQEALIDHKLEVKEAELEKRHSERQAQAEQGKAVQEFWNNYNEGVADYLETSGTDKDVFLEKGSFVQEALGTLDPDLSQSLIMGVAEAGAEVTAYLADNPHELDALITERSIINQGMMLNEFKSKVVLNRSAGKVSNAPDPIPEIGGSGGGISQTMSPTEAHAKGLATYKAERAKRLATEGKNKSRIIRR
jgi:hypothetical protein